jgi:hypothetical protein
MNERSRRVFFVLLTTFLGLSAMAVTAGGLASSGAGARSSMVSRDLEPVMVTGTTVSGMNGLPVDELFLYAYRGSSWEQIPYQVDEVTAGGTYTTYEDGRMDANDEVVFMTQDLGQQPPPGSSVSESLPIGFAWYELAVTNPISPSEMGWAYLVHSWILTPSFVTDYVDFDVVNHRLSSERYRLGFATPDPWVDYLTLGTSSVDLLDRSKSRLFCSVILLCPITEEIEGVTVLDELIKDGPVRVIVRNGRVLGYQAMVSWMTAVTIPQALYGDVRFSLDFAPAASGATFYNEAITTGVTVDGAADSVPAQPTSSWIQLSTSDGSMVQVADISQLGGVLSNYYEDDNTFKFADTGDKFRYGEAGIYIADPDPFISYQFNLYFPPGMQPNRGAEFEAYYQQPLQTTATGFVVEQPTLYLPLVVNN